MEKNKIKDFLISLSNKIDDDNIELYKKIIEGSEIKHFDGPEEFFYAVIYPWENFITGFLNNEISLNRDVVFIYENSQYIDRSFSNLFEKFEGSACSSDKSRTIIKRLLHFYLTGDKIEFDYSAEYTYHLPTEIFKTHDVIVLFYEGLKSLLYGNNEKYLKALETLNLVK